MTKAEALFLEEILSYNLSVEVREGYSGRGMYGEETHAVVVDGSEGDVINCILNSGRASESDGGWRLRFDSMGRSSIVIY